MTTASDPRAAEKAALLERYDRQIEWYWVNSGRQKKRFIYTRFVVLVLGALVTLIASLAAATFVEDTAFWDTTFKILTPVLAAVLAVVTGLTQTFQWGAAWREMNLAAMSLEKERDRIRLTPPYRIDAVGEIERFNDLVIDETRRYFERVTGATRVAQLEGDVTARVESAAATVAAARPRSVDLSPTPAAAAASHGDDAGGSYAADTAYGGDEGGGMDATAEEAYGEDEGEGGSPFAAEGASDWEEGGDEPELVAGPVDEEEGEGGSPFAAEGGDEEELP